MTTFSKRLRELRDQADLTQKEVADAVHVDKQTISQYELGKRQPDFEKLERLCDFFNVSSDYLLGKSDLTMRYVNTEELKLLNSKSARKIPIHGKVVAGVPEEALADALGSVEIPKSWKGEFGALKVKGESMAPALIDGDIVIFRKQDSASSGDLVIAIVDNENATIKKLLRSTSSVTLVPFNPSYDPIVFNKKDAKRIQILGKVVELRRKY